MSVKKTGSPKPVVVTTVCSMCGLDWKRHGADPTTEDCIRLLKAELAMRPTVINVGRPYPLPQPYPYPVPYPRPYGPTWWQPQPTITCQASSSAFSRPMPAYNIPRVIEGTCQAVAT